MTNNFLHFQTNNKAVIGGAILRALPVPILTVPVLLGIRVFQFAFAFLNRAELVLEI